MKREHITSMDFEIAQIARLDNRENQHNRSTEPEVLQVVCTPLRDDCLGERTFSFITSYYNGLGQKFATSPIGTKLHLDISMMEKSEQQEEDAFSRGMKAIYARAASGEIIEPSKSYPVDGKGDW